MTSLKEFPKSDEMIALAIKKLRDARINKTGFIRSGSYFKALDDIELELLGGGKPHD